MDSKRSSKNTNDKSADRKNDSSVEFADDFSGSDNNNTRSR